MFFQQLFFSCQRRRTLFFPNDLLFVCFMFYRLHGYFLSLSKLNGFVLFLKFFYPNRSHVFCCFVIVNNVIFLDPKFDVFFDFKSTRIIIYLSFVLFFSEKNVNVSGCMCFSSCSFVAKLSFSISDQIDGENSHSTFNAAYIFRTDSEVLENE